MIGNRAQRLIGRWLLTAVLIATMVVLVLIYVRSGGGGTGAGTVVLPASASRSSSGGQPGEPSSAGEAAGTGGEGPGGGEAGEASEGGGEPSGGGAEAAGGNAGPPLASGTGGAGASGTYTGSVVHTLYGPVQVAVAEEGGRIVDVSALQLPTDHPQSLYISERVAPLLREEVLQAQSAEINIVSGATFTSEGFAQSLQQALSHVHP